MEEYLGFRFVKLIFRTGLHLVSVSVEDKEGCDWFGFVEAFSKVGEVVMGVEEVVDDMDEVLEGEN